jgi:hypothetical protein
MDKEQEIFHQRTHTYHFFFIHGLFDEIMHLQEFIEFTEQFFTEKLIIKTEEEKDIRNLHPVFNAENQLGIVFPKILWRTAFLHSFFLTESSLDQICRNIQIAQNISLSLTDISGKGIKRAELFLRKLANVTLPFESKEWQDILDFNKIRNAFVHSDGIISKGNKDLINVSKKYIGLYLPEFGNYDYSELNLDKEFCVFSLKTILDFFIALHKNLNELKK